MKTTVTIGYNPNERPDLINWMLKHKVSFMICRPDIAISRALES